MMKRALVTLLQSPDESLTAASTISDSDTVKDPLYSVAVLLVLGSDLSVV